MPELTYHIITFGCQMNHSDSERMAGILAQMGFNTTTDQKDADVVIINACSVRQKAIDRIWGQLHVCDNIRKKRPDRPLYTVLTGCVLPSDRPKFSEKFDLYFPMKELPQLPEKMEAMLVDETAGGLSHKLRPNHKKVVLNVDQIMADKQIEYQENIKTLRHESSAPLNPISQIPGTENIQHYLQTEPQYTEMFTAFVPIMTGCNAFCTYCAVPLTRGREVSRKPEEIIIEVEKLVEQGYKEITLLGQIINKYNVHYEDDLVPFLEETLARHNSALSNIPEFQDEDFTERKLFKFHHLLAFLNELMMGPAPQNLGDVGPVPRSLGEVGWLRFTSSHPKWFSDALIDTIARCERVPAYMHLPVQAGSDTVLKRMLRPYTVEEYKGIITQIREKIPGVAITTDCIVGFCGETDEEYQQTRELFEWVKYDMAFIAQYSTRPGTKADIQYEDDVPHEVKKFREEDLTKVLANTALEHNKTYLKQTVRVLVEKATEDKNTPGRYNCIGRTGTMKPVKFSSGRNSRGQFVDVKVTDVYSWGMSGELV